MIKLILILILFCACTTSKKQNKHKYYDSTIIMIDTIHVHTITDSMGNIDTVRYNKREVRIKHSPDFMKSKGWYFALVSFTAILVIIIRITTK